MPELKLNEVQYSSSKAEIWRAYIASTLEAKNQKIQALTENIAAKTEELKALFDIGADAKSLGDFRVLAQKERAAWDEARRLQALSQKRESEEYQYNLKRHRQHDQNELAEQRQAALKKLTP